MYSKHEGLYHRSKKIQIYILLHLQADQCHTTVFTQVVPLNSCDLFFLVLVTRMKELDYWKIVQENLIFCARDFGEFFIKNPDGFL